MVSIALVTQKLNESRQVMRANELPELFQLYPIHPSSSSDGV